MGILKNNNSKIETFKFGSFGQKTALANSGEVEKFEFGSMDDIEFLKNSLSDLQLREERQFETGAGFTIDPEVRARRGHNKQEDEDYELKVQAEVEKRIAELRVTAEEEGYKNGQEQGFASAQDQAQKEFEVQIDQLTKTVENLQTDCSKIFESNKNESYRIIKNLTKWIVLKEVDEKYYLTRLLEKLVYEINAKANLTVRVNEESFGYMPEIIKLVERKLGKLSNIRVESDLALKGNGIILESENSIVDGSLESQLKSIDKLFEDTRNDG